MKRRLYSILVTAVLTLGGMALGVSAASAHARCDGKTHDHYYWTGRTATWHHLYYVKQKNRFAPDVTWAYAESSDGEVHANRCFW